MSHHSSERIDLELQQQQIESSYGRSHSAIGNRPLQQDPVVLQHQIHAPLVEEQIRIELEREKTKQLKLELEIEREKTKQNKYKQVAKKPIPLMWCCIRFN
jgi:hypothetical protein